MPKESFEQFVKREEEKLDKAEKIVEGIKERWKDKIEEFEMVEKTVEKSIKELKKLWEENEGRIKRRYEIFSFFYSLSLPEVPSSLLERISNKFLKKFDWEKFKERKLLECDLGLFLSAFLKKNVENYILSQKNKGIKEENIKPIKVHLKVKELPIRLDYLGYQNPKKLHLIIEGDCGYWVGNEMEGGKIIVEGGCGRETGHQMQGGKIIVKGDCEGWTGSFMKGGELNIKGEVEFFDKSAFSPDNKGTIIWKNTKVWENGKWTKEGEEMLEKGELPLG